MDGRTPFTGLPDDATGCPDQGHNHPRQQREQERKTTRKRKKEMWSGGKKRGLKIIVRLRTRGKRRKTLGSHKAGKEKIEGWRNWGMKYEN